jgi:hypothetical protein
MQQRLPVGAFDRVDPVRRGLLIVSGRRAASPAAARSLSGDGGEHEDPGHAASGHPAEHLVLEDGPFSEEQCGSAEEHGDPRRLCVPERCLMTSSSPTEIAIMPATMTRWANITSRQRVADRGRGDGPALHLPGTVDLDPPQHYRGRERHHDRGARHQNQRLRELEEREDKHQVRKQGCVAGC